MWLILCIRISLFGRYLKQICMIVYFWIFRNIVLLINFCHGLATYFTVWSFRTQKCRRISILRIYYRVTCSISDFDSLSWQIGHARFIDIIISVIRLRQKEVRLIVFHNRCSKWYLFKCCNKFLIFTSWRHFYTRTILLQNRFRSRWITSCSFFILVSNFII